MAELPLLQVDAFTDRPLGGNPCAVVLDAEGLDAATMQAVAREMNLSETAFVLPSDRADFGARFFTPGAEVPMAGHPTLATIRALLDAGRLSLSGERTETSLELPAGVFRVEVEAQGGRVVCLTMEQGRPEFGAFLDPSEVLPALGLAPGDALEGLAPSVVSTGTPQLMVPVTGLAAVRRAAPDARAHAALARTHRFFSTTSSPSKAWTAATPSHATSRPWTRPSRIPSPARPPVTWGRYCGATAGWAPASKRTRATGWAARAAAGWRRSGRPTTWPGSGWGAEPWWCCAAAW